MTTPSKMNLATFGAGHSREIRGIISGARAHIEQRVATKRAALVEKGALAELCYWDEAMTEFVSAITKGRSSASVEVFEQAYAEHASDNALPLVKRAAALLVADGFKAEATQFKRYNHALDTDMHVITLALEW